MATQMIGKVRRARKVDPNGNIYYDRGVSDIIIDPIRGVSVKQDIDELRKAMQVCLAFVAANPKGMDGKSAYQIAVDEGYEGSETDWLESLVGAPGHDGLSAYEIAVVYLGFVGTEEEFINSLRGEKGEKGDSPYDLAVKYGYEGTEEEYVAISSCDIMSEEEIQAIYDAAVAHLTMTGVQEDGYQSVTVLSAKVDTMQEDMKKTVVSISSDEGALNVTHMDESTDTVPIVVKQSESEISDAVDSVMDA
jgi:hypothetical protein